MQRIRLRKSGVPGLSREVMLPFAKTDIGSGHKLREMLVGSFFPRETQQDKYNLDCQSLSEPGLPFVCDKTEVGERACC